MKTTIAWVRRDQRPDGRLFRLRSVTLVVTALVIAGIASAGVRAQARFKAVKVTDTKGVVTEIIRDPAHRQVITDIDYYVNPLIVGRSDLTLDGIRIRQGDGTVDVSWDRVHRIDVTKETSNGIEALLTLTGDPKAPKAVILISRTKQGIHGWTALGEFSLDLPKIKAIEVVR
jgi:hypothetical protein